MRIIPTRLTQVTQCLTCPCGAPAPGRPEGLWGSGAAAHDSPRLSNGRFQFLRGSQKERLVSMEGLPALPQDRVLVPRLATLPAAEGRRVCERKAFAPQLCS